MKKEFCTKSQSLALKNLGFDEACLAFYINDNDFGEFLYFDLKRHYNSLIEDSNKVLKDDNEALKDCTAPLIQQAFGFFREKYGWISLIQGGYDNSEIIFTYVIWDSFKDCFIDSTWSTYEEAEQACLDKLIELCETNTTITTA